MGRLACVPWLIAGTLIAEVHTLTLNEAVEKALAQNPDLIIARLDEQKALHQVRVARDPFIPKIYAGSGLAYTSGMPMSIEGSAPTVVQARATASIINRTESHRLARAREEAKGAALDTQAKRDDIVLRTLELYLEAENAGRVSELARAQAQGLERVAAVVQARVEEGRELPIEKRRAELDLARARQRAERLESDQADAECSLAAVLGLPPGDRVRTSVQERTRPELPETEEAAVRQALEGSLEIKRMESSLAAKGIQVKEENAAKLPRLSLVAQYGLFARFNNYEDFFQKFQRHNGQVGIAFEVPVYAGQAPGARAAQAEVEIERLKTALSSKRTRIALETRRAFEEVKKAQTAADVARLDLEVARESLGIVLARKEEGRAYLRDVEAARYLENEKWIAFYDSLQALELARYRLLDETGGVFAALRPALRH